MERLVLICEGGAHTVEYFHNNKVFPGAVVFDALKFREMAPYLGKEDEILVVIKGLTDFTLAEVYSLLDDIATNKEKVKDITILSNINLGKVQFNYFLYVGDLFYGALKEVLDGKVHDFSTDEEAQKGKRKKGKDKLEKPKDALAENTVMGRYKKYSRNEVRFQIYGRKPKEFDPTFELDAVTDKVVKVDLFK